VTTVLRDAGLRLERVHLAEIRSEDMIRSLVPDGDIVRLIHATAPEFIAAVRQKGDGVYLVGLDFHTGFIVLDGDRADFCHSSFVKEQHAVLCEPAARSRAFASAYRVAGRLANDALLVDWLEERDIPTRVGRGRPPAGSLGQ
jgi:hypothetical protein